MDLPTPNPSPTHSPHVIIRWIHRLAWGYAIGLGILFAVFFEVGERHPLLAAMLYLPPIVLVFPGCLLTLIHLPFRPRQGAVLVFIFIILTLYAFDFRWSWAKTPAPRSTETGTQIKVFTYNIGQSGNTSQATFLEKHQPEILAFQEVNFHTRVQFQAAPFQTYPFRVHHGEFTLLSQHPILSQKILLGHSGPFAAHYHLLWKGRIISVYSVHLKSPRRALKNTREIKAIARSIKFTFQRQGSDDLTLFWRSQRSDLHKLLFHVHHDPLPSIVLGDTNAPTLGRLHREFTQQLTDVHEAVGRGAGFTFPGDARLWFTGHAPWLRLDKVLVNEKFQPLAVEVEPQQASQHRSLAATLRATP